MDSDSFKGEEEIRASSNAYTAKIPNIYKDLADEIESNQQRAKLFSFDQTCLMSDDDSVCLAELRKLESMLDSGYNIFDLDEDVIDIIFSIAGNFSRNPKLVVSALEILSYICFLDDDELVEHLPTNILGLFLDVISYCNYTEALILAFENFHNALTQVTKLLFRKSLL